MPGMSGSSRLINGRMRRSHGAWRLRRLRGHRSLRLLRSLVLVMSLERVVVALTLLMMELLIIPRTPPPAPQGPAAAIRAEEMHVEADDAADLMGGP